MRAEYFLTLSFTLFIISLYYLHITKENILERENEIVKKREKIIEIKELKRNWGNRKRVMAVIDNMRRYVNPKYIKNFNNRKGIFEASFRDLPPSVYNAIMKDVWNTRMQIISFHSRKLIDKYEVTLKCKY